MSAGLYCCDHIMVYDHAQDCWVCTTCRNRMTGAGMKSYEYSMREKDEQIVELHSTIGELRKRIAELENGPERKKWWLTLKFGLGALLFIEVWMNAICWEFMSAPVSAAAVLTIIATATGLVCSFIYEEER